MSYVIEGQSDDSNFDAIHELSEVLAARSMGRANPTQVWEAVQKVVREAGANEAIMVLFAYADGMRNSGEPERAAIVQSTIAEFVSMIGHPQPDSQRE